MPDSINTLIQYSENNSQFAVHNSQLNLTANCELAIANWLADWDGVSPWEVSHGEPPPSWTLAPMDVPERRSCFDSVLATSEWVLKKLQALMTLTAKILVLSVIGILLDIVKLDEWYLHFNLRSSSCYSVIANCELRIANWSEA